MGKQREELDSETAGALSRYALEYGEMLFEAYARRELARDPSLLD